MRLRDCIIKIVILVLAILFITRFPVYAGEVEKEEAKDGVNFERIDLPHGLLGSAITCIFQDREGFLWFGTDWGLHKYDGYGYKSYYHQLANSKSLGHNTIRCIIQDRSGALWLGTYGGLDKFDPGTEEFTHYKNAPGNPNSLSDDIVHSLCEDRRGTIWIGTQGGLDKFSPGTGKFAHYRVTLGDTHSLNDNYVRTIYEDSSGTLWIGTQKGGLNKFSPGTGIFVHYLADPTEPNTLSNNWVLSIRESPKGTLWIGTYGGGLDKFSPAGGVFTHYRAIPGDPNSLSDDQARIVYPDSTGILWIGTTSGLNRFDPQKKQFTRYLADPANPGGFKLNIIRSILEDRTGILWVGTEGEGIIKIDRKKKKIRHYHHVPGDTHSLGDNRVTAIYEDRTGTFWIGTEAGLNQWNRENNTFTHYRADPNNSTGLRSDRVWSIYEDRSGDLWIGTLEGLYEMDREAGTFVRWPPDPEKTGKLSDNQVLSICEDREGYLWIGTIRGLNRLDKERRTRKTYLHSPGDPTSISHDAIETIFEDRSRMLWIGTAKGLNQFDREKETFTCFPMDSKDPGRLCSPEIKCIYQDRTGTLWVGTPGGLKKYDRGKNTFTPILSEPGMPDIIMGILEDEKGNLWLGTNTGIINFDPGTGSLKIYDSWDGLQGDEFSYACRKSKNGEMFFGGNNGFNAFFPGQLIENPHLPAVFITDLKISNKSVPIGEELDGRVILEKHISETAAITLSYKHTTLSFEYVGLHYAAPGSNQYAYKMEGLEQDWNYVGSRRYAIYPYLKPGDYVFRVKASNNDNLWNEGGASIRIRIPPSLWRRWWFWVLAGAALLSMVFGGFLYRTQRLRKKLAEQEQIQILLKQSRDEMEKSRDIAELRSTENEKIIVAISSLFITVDARGKISQWNRAAETFFKIPKPDTVDQRLDDLLKPFIPGDKTAEILDKGLLQAQASNNVEVPVTFKRENESKLLMAQINPIIDKNGKNVGFLLLAEDITHQKREQMRLLISQKLEALGQMAAGIAHEIRSPLQYIGDNVQFLLETFDHLVEFCREIRTSLKEAPQSGEHQVIEKLNQYLENTDFDYFMKEIPASLDHMVNGVTRVSNIVKSMSTFSYMGEEVDERADINELLESTLVVAHNRLKKAADLQTDYSPGLPPISCGRGDLNQVFLNILINAADAVAETGKRGLIKISTKLKDNELIIEIFDNGAGIPEEIKNKMFTPFFTTKKVGHGTGQGLALSYSIIVGKYNGKLYYESKVREGTTFFIHLPIGTMGE